MVCRFGGINSVRVLIDEQTGKCNGEQGWAAHSAAHPAAGRGGVLQPLAGRSFCLRLGDA